MLRIALFATFLLSVTGIASAQFSPGNPLSGLEKLKNFEARRSSSCDPDLKNGNADSRPIPPGGTITIADLEGPGAIAHIWFTIAHSVKNYSRLLTIRIYWDGEEHPSVECPIGDFFGIGHGVDVPLNSMPIRVSSQGRGRNCYWPMPFRKSAKITITNESDVRCDAFYYYVDWQKHASLPDDTAYFHAMYRQEFPCKMGQNYLIADLEGRGHYVGTVQSVVTVSESWYGEGDDFFFIDGDKEPTLRGTGSEDYFCDGWGFWPHPDGLYYGAPMSDWNGAGKLISVYRWHIPDPVPFKKSLRVEIEHKGPLVLADNKGSGYTDRDDLMSSVAYWYQIEPHKAWPALPAGRDRLPFRETNLLVGGKAVPQAKHSDAKLEAQQLHGATGGTQLFFQPKEEKAWIEIPFKAEKEAYGNLVLRACHSFDYGRYRVLLDGKEIGTFDFYQAGTEYKDINLGRIDLSPGDHTLKFECVGKNAASQGYFLGIDALSLETTVYNRSPKVDPRTK